MASFLSPTKNPFSFRGSFVYVVCATCLTTGSRTFGQCEMEMLRPADNASEDKFGIDVAISGDIAIIGALGDDDACPSDPDCDSGSAYIYYRDPKGIWSEVKKLAASDAAPGDRFGTCVAINGDLAMVSASEDQHAGVNSGSAYIYSRNHGGPDNWGEVKKVAASDAGPEDYFGGTAVAISEEVAIVGAWGNDDEGFYTGAAYVFVRDQGGPNQWGEVKKLVALIREDYRWFGYSAALAGDIAIVGEWGSDDACKSDPCQSGAAYVFGRDEGGPDNWGHITKLVASDTAPRDYFGYSVAICDNLVVVGARDEDDAGADAGAAYIFEYDGEGTWNEIKKLTASDGENSDRFGVRVGISGDLVIVGADSSDDACPGNINCQSGSAYIFARNEGGLDNWGEVAKITASDPGPGHWFGFRLGISGDTAIVGAYGNDHPCPDKCDFGSAYIFQIDYQRVDCNDNGVCDFRDLAVGNSVDANGNGVPDECEIDCNGNGVLDLADLKTGTSQDCNENQVPDECDIEERRSDDCNANGIPDECDIGDGTSADDNANGIPDECEPASCPQDIAPKGGDGQINVDDLLAVINAWGPCPTKGACTADIAPKGGDGTVNVDDLLAIINAWGPCP